MAAAQKCDPEARAYAYQDDLQIVSLAEARTEAKVAFEQSCSLLGLRPNSCKEEVWLGPGVDPVVLDGQSVTVVPRPRVLKHGGLTELPVVVDNGAADGSQLATDAPECEALIERRVAFLRRVDVLRAAGLPVQLCLLLVRAKTASDFVFVARACGIPAACAKRLDTTVLQAVERLLGPDDWNDIARRRVFHPWNDGGMGFTSVELVAPGAYAASWNATADKVSRHLGLPSVALLRAAAPWADTCLGRAELVARLVTDDPLEPDAASPGASRPSQRALTRAAVSQEVASVAAALSTNPVAQTVRLSAGGPGAAAFLMRPRKPAHYFRDEQFVIAARVRLMLPVPRGQGLCQHIRADGRLCGAALDAEGVHAMTCLVGAWATRRHDSCCIGIAAYAESNGSTAEREVTLPVAAPDRPAARMDVVIVEPERPQPVLVDFTVTTPLAQEMIRRGRSSQVPGAAAEAAARHKRSKYPNVLLTPFAVETYGRLGEDARALALQLAPTQRRLRSEAISGLYQDISRALQKGNADAILASALRVRTGLAAMGGGAPTPSEQFG